MIAPTLNAYLAISVLLFAIGLLGVLIRRNVLVIFMCLALELTLPSHNHTKVGGDGVVLVTLGYFECEFHSFSLCVGSGDVASPSAGNEIGGYGRNLAHG